MTVRILQGDCREVLKTLPDESVHCVVTSPPYFGLRDYGVDGQIGLEPTPDEFVAVLVGVFREVRRMLRDDGTVWLNLGDSYNAHPNQRSVTDKAGDKQQTMRGSTASPSRSVAGLKPKDMIGIPWRVAFALQADGWYLRQDVIWSKPNAMPESVRDRCTKAHEYIFLLSKSARYYFDTDAIAEPCTQDEFRPTFRGGAYCNNSTFDNSEGGTSTVVGNIKRSGNKQRKPASERGCPQDGVAGSVPREGTTRNKRSVWTVATQPFSEAHFATFPPALIEPCILAGCPAGGTVLDPFGGAGTTGLVADRLQRDAILIELNPSYVEMAESRIRNDAPLFSEVHT